jgi:hypothetical protein
MQLQMHSPFGEDTLADFLSELSGFPHLTTFVLEMSFLGVNWPQESDRALSLAMTFMNANLALRRVAFGGRGSWPCYARVGAGLNTRGIATAVFEGFDILGPESYRDF